MQEKKYRKNDFLNKFNNLRESRKLSITEACEMIGISRALYYSIRDKDQPVSDKAFERLLNAEERRQGASFYKATSESTGGRVAEPGGTLSKAEMRVLVGEIRLRLEMIQQAFENLHDE